MTRILRQALLLGVCLLGPAVRAQAPQHLDVNVFNAGSVWPIWVAQDQGFFAGNGLDVNVSPTPGSLVQMEGLIDGKFDIAMTAIDNLIAYMAGQGEAKTEQTPDIVAVMGSDNGFLSLLTAPSVTSYAGLRGAKLSVDALTTGFAFVLRKMLETEGVRDGEYTLEKAGGLQQRYEALLAGSQMGTLSTAPFTFLAEEKGFHVLGNAVSVLGHYQGVVAGVRRDWAAAHREALIAYIRSYVAALTWLYDPANKAAALVVFRRHLPSTSAENAAKSYDLFLDPNTGFDRNAAIDAAGVKTVVEIRQAYAQPHKALQEPAAYYDLTYYNAAMKPR